MIVNSYALDDFWNWITASIAFIEHFRGFDSGILIRGAFSQYLESGVLREYS